MLSILIWWAVPAVAGVLASVVIAITRRVRASRADLETLDRYQRARRALARATETAAAGEPVGRSRRE